MESVQQLKELTILLSAIPRQSYPHILVVLKVGFVTINDYSVIDIQPQSP